MNKSGEIDHVDGSLVSGGIFTIVTPESSFVKIENKGVYTDPLVFTFTGGTHTAGVKETAVGGGTISSSAQKVKADGVFVMLEGDTGTLSGSYIDLSTGASVLFTSDVEISDAGQSKVEGS